MFWLTIQNMKVQIFEHSEAEQIIKLIADNMKEDITPISRGGRGRNKTYWFNYPCSFDIETTTVRSGEYGYNHADGRPAAVPYLFQFNIYNVVFMVRYIKEAIDIFEWVSKYFDVSNKKHLCFVVHNLSFEYGFFKDYWKLNENQCFAVDIHHPLTLQLENGLVFKDSYKLTGMSLETLTKDWSKTWIKNKDLMDYNKRRMPWDSLDNDTLVYSALDVLGLSDAIQEFFTALNTGVWTKSPTRTSFIRANLKSVLGVGVKKRSKDQKKYFRTLDKLKLTPELYNMLLRQARGGNTHANRAITGLYIGTPEGKGVLPFDIESSYPDKMVNWAEYPIGVWREIDTDAGIEDILLLEENGYCTLFDITFINPQLKERVPVPYLANSKCRTLKGVSKYSDNGRYMYGAEMLSTTIFGIELPIILDQYNIDDAVILRGYYSRKGYLPDLIRNFVLEKYAAKTKLRGIEGQEVEYKIAKGDANGIYGMMFTKPIRLSYKFSEGEIIEIPEPDLSTELKKYQNSQSRYFVNYSWGAMVSTLGRLHLQMMIDAIGFDHFLYCDTDSTYSKDPARTRRVIKKLDKKLSAERHKSGLPINYYDSKGELHELGAITEEKECGFKTFGAKKYIKVIDGTVISTIAGVPKKEGSELIKDHDDFYIGKIFKGTDTNKLCLWYNNDEGLTFTEGDKSVSVKSNIALLPVDYELGIGDDYMMCLSVEGVNPVYSFGQTNAGITEDYI